MFKDLKIMKATNNTIINSIMRTYMKYICAVVMMLGVSVNTWAGANFAEASGSSDYYWDYNVIDYGGYFPSLSNTLPEGGTCSDWSFIGWTDTDLEDSGETTSAPSTIKRPGDQLNQYTYYWYSLYARNSGGTTNNYSYTMVSNSWTAVAGGTNTLNLKSWTATATYSSKPNSLNWDDDKGLAWGTGSKPISSLTITSTDFSGNIKSVTINSSIGGSVQDDYKLTVTVGGTTYLCGGAKTIRLNSTATDYKFEGMSSGTISISWVNGSSYNKATYVKSIAVEYISGGTTYYHTQPACSCTELSAPTNAVVDEENIDGVHGKTKIKWDRVSNNSGYIIDFYKDGVFYATVERDQNKESGTSTFGVGTWTWTVAAKGDGSTYCETGNSSTDGEEFCVGADLTSLTPSGLNVDATATDAVRVSWNELSGAGKYYLTFTNVSTSASTSTNTTNTYKNVSTVPLNKAFRVDIYAKNACLDDYYSLTASTTFTLHNVSFDMQGHGSAISAVGAVEGDKISAPSAPTATGYTFGGWYKESGCTNAWVFGTDVVNENTTLYAKWTPNDVSLKLNKNNSDVSGSSNGSASVKYDATSLTSISHATRTGYSIEGYYAEPGCTNKVLTSAGALVNYTGYVVSSKWARATTPTTLYAKWAVNSHTLAVSSVSNVTIESTTPDVDAGGSTSVDYGTTVTLAYSGVTSGYYWGGWNVYRTGDASTKVTVTSNQFTMPDYDVTVSAVVYPRANLVTRCPSVDFEVTGDNAWLTSYAGVEVYTDIATNQITIQCDDWGSANRIYVSYLDGEGTTITKTSSLFRLCDASTFNYMDASNDYFAVSGTDHEDGVKYAISYKPGASEYDQIDTWTLRLTAANGTTPLDYQDITIHGRALPEKFVIAAKIDGVWKALPADIRTTSGTMDKAPYPISVNDPDEPTTAYYAPKAALYSGAARPTGAVNKNRGGIRLHTETEDGSDGYLQGGRSNSSASLWRTSSGCTTGMQSWYLRSTTFGDYKINVDPTIYVSSGSGEGDDGEGSTSTLLDRKLCVDAGKIGWYKTSADDFRILKVTNEVDLREATVYEWGEHGVVLNADMTDVASVTAHIENGMPSAATVTAVNAASLTAGKYVKVDAGALTIGAIANEKKVLNLHWKNSGGTEIGVSSIVIPRVIASSGTMSTLDATKGNWNTEVHVLPGQTLTADGGSFGSSTVVVKQLIVYPGATVNVSTGTLTATTLRLRNGWTRAGSTQYNTARVYIADDAALTKTTASMDYDIYNSAEGRHYYPLAVPFQTAVSTIDYADATLATASVYNKHFVIKEYNGARRATNGEDRENNWTVVSGSGNLDPCKGYIITAVAVKGEAIIRVPLSYNDGWTADGELATYSATTKNVIAVTAHTGTAASAHNRHKGWNMLGVPFMSCYGNVDDIYSGGGSAALINGELVVNTSADENMEYQSTTIPYVSVPSHDFAEYIQTDISEAELRPGWSFLVQVNTSGNLTFAVGNQQTGDAGQVYAPRRMTEEDVVVKTGIVLSDAESSDKTTFLISSQYSGAEYEIGADLEKMFGTGYTLAVYSLSNDTRLAYNAMSPTDAQQAIPLGFRAPADGEYTFSLNPKYADAPLERVDLIDYQLGTLTNLLTSSYTFQTGQTQNDTRFALNIVKQKETPTDVETVTGDGLPVNGVYKVLINEQLYIIQGDKMYDATGKRVKGINK